MRLAPPLAAQCPPSESCKLEAATKRASPLERPTGARESYQTARWGRLRASWREMASETAAYTSSRRIVLTSLSSSKTTVRELQQPAQHRPTRMAGAGSYVGDSVARRPSPMEDPASRASVANWQRSQLQYHDDNNSSSNNNHNNGARLAGQAEAERSATLTSSNSHLANANHHYADQNGRSLARDKQSQVRLVRNYHHHHHHYPAEHHTDSDLTSPLYIQQQQYQRFPRQPNHYDDNILLFATEHRRASQPQSSCANRPDQAARALAGQTHLLVGSSQLSGAGQAQTDCERPARHSQWAQPVGRFVSQYPAWRRAQSPPASQLGNYAFHVPARAARGQQRHYGYLARADGGRAQLAGSGRAQTVSHLPQMVRLGIDDTGATYERLAGAHADADSDAQGQAKVAQLAHSEGDLLRVHRLRVHGHLLDQGPDNPFRPGTELSWEADMMVRLMQRGYPVSELPVLVQTAKQVARERSQSPERQRSRSLEGRKGAGERRRPAQANKSPLPRSRTLPADESLREHQERPDGQQQSQTELHELQLASASPGKQVWANSLVRAKSVPRFAPADGDSIDQLISSIEREMSDLLAADEQPEVKPRSSADQEQLPPSDKARRPKTKTKTKKKKVGGTQADSSPVKRKANSGSASRSTARDLTSEAKQGYPSSMQKAPAKCCRIH